MTTSPQPRPPLSVVKRREPIFASGALLNVVALAILGGILVTLWILVPKDGWHYYRTPIGVRGYEKAHRILRPSGTTGHLLGIVGTLFLFSTLFYVIRKRSKRLSKLGSMKGWLEFHIFCGVFGPILVTFHTSFKFNGIISVAYWSMVLVVASGFVGRYLFVRIPKTIRGKELTQAEIEERARALKESLADSTIPAGLLLRIEQVEREVIENHRTHHGFLHLIADEMSARRKTAALRREIRKAGLSRQLLHEALDVIHERAILLRRIDHLKKTRQLFQVWHVFHRPLVWLMFLIFFIHLGVALYFGYTIFGR